MSAKRYRFCLLILALVLSVAGVIAVYYFTGKDEQYKGGLLVQNEWVLEEEAA